MYVLSLMSKLPQLLVGDVDGEEGEKEGGDAEGDGLDRVGVEGTGSCCNRRGVWTGGGGCCSGVVFMKCYIRFLAWTASEAYEGVWQKHWRQLAVRLWWVGEGRLDVGCCVTWSLGEKGSMT